MDIFGRRHDTRKAWKPINILTVAKHIPNGIYKNTGIKARPLGNLKVENKDITAVKSRYHTIIFTKGT